ncbi:MAG: hypothetical protein LBH07_02965, partial [Treponema sp.]|nr:hypothetical protein [Treponema sp.]
MKKNTGFGRFFCFFFFISMGIFFSCDQEPLFWDIAHEYPPIEPIIGGRVTRIVSAGTILGGDYRLYVTNGSIWEYNTAGPVWRQMAPSPGGSIIDLAVTNDILFALTSGGKILKYSTNWTEFNLSGVVHIFGAEIYLFASVLTGTPGRPDAYKIVCLDTSGTEIKTLDYTGLLMGAVYDGTNYYLGTLGGGVHKFDGSTVTVTNFNNYIVGLTFDTSTGRIYAVTPTGIQHSTNGTDITTISGYNLSGAAAIWNDGTNNLLLTGILRSGSLYGYGYREILINSGGHGSSYNLPGNAGIVN